MRTLISIILSLLMCVPQTFAKTPRSEAEMPEDDLLDVTIDGFKLELQLFVEGERIRLKRTSIVVDEFDFALIRGKLQSFEEDLRKAVLRAKTERDELCREEKALLKRDHDELMSQCENKLLKSTERVIELTKKLEDTKKAHESELFKHYLAEGLGASVIIGLLVILIRK